MLKFSEPSADAFGIIKDIRFYFVMVFCILLIILYLVSNYLSKRITHPIKILKLHMESLLSTHKLNMAVAYEGSSDEVKQMTHTFDFLLEELSYMVQKTMEKTAEAESVKSVKTTLDSMIEHTTTGIITIDGKGVITSMNPRIMEVLELNSTFVGQTLKQLENQRFDPLIQLIENSIDTVKQIEDAPCQLFDPEVQLVVSTLIQKDIYQTTLGVTVMIQNVADKERFEHSVIRAKKLSELGELSAGVAHEIRNPLASIRGYTQMAILEVGDGAVATHDLQIVLNEVDRLDRLIERFLSFASPNFPSYKLSDMNPLIEEVASFFDQQLHTKQLKLHFHLHNPSQFEFDSDQIRQVLINLMLNAIQASHEGGQIKIASQLHDNEGVYSLSIEDDGDGIPGELHDRIFTPFFTTRKGGTGLGLAICARIVENHRGSIELVSSKTAGTAITIKLPTKRGQ
jgi:nitrogen fixation/metabolism regulation signal transduction histidine kinase